jgi:hypothetical protein
MRSIVVDCVLLLTLVVGCGPDTGPGDGSGGGTASEGSAGPTSASTGPGVTSVDSTATSGSEVPPAGCSCRTPPEDGFDCADLATTTCEGGALCDELFTMCTRPNPDLYMCDQASITYDEAVLTCMLEALRDRTPGTLAIVIENDTCGLEGCGDDRTEISVLAGNLAVMRTCSSSPLSAETRRRRWPRWTSPRTSTAAWPSRPSSNATSACAPGSSRAPRCASDNQSCSQGASFTSGPRIAGSWKASWSSAPSCWSASRSLP